MEKKKCETFLREYEAKPNTMQICGIINYRMITFRKNSDRNYEFQWREMSWLYLRTKIAQNPMAKCLKVMWRSVQFSDHFCCCCACVLFSVAFTFSGWFVSICQRPRASNKIDVHVGVGLVAKRTQINRLGALQWPRLKSHLIYTIFSAYFFFFLFYREVFDDLWRFDKTWQNQKLLTRNLFSRLELGTGHSNRYRKMQTQCPNHKVDR